jgi:hypothetical protein
MANLVGNSGGQMLSSVAVFGPVMLDSNLSLPPATLCGMLPSILFIQYSTPPAIPPSLAGDVATYVFLLEIDGEEEPYVQECIVEVL